MSKFFSKQFFLVVPFYLIYSVKILILAQPAMVVEPICDDVNHFTTNSSFKTNLDRALAVLPTTNSGYGFFNSSSGQNPNTAHAIALCRGDTDSISCTNCVNYSIANLTTACPNQKTARVYYENCLLRYSGNNILRTTEVDFPIWDPSKDNATDPAGFHEDMLKLMDNLTVVAARGGPLLKYAADTMTRSDKTKIYGLVQCTPDLTSQQCSNCLKDAASVIAGPCCFGKIGVRVYFPMCYLRYENYRFYNDAPNIPSPPSPPPPWQPSPTGKKAHSTRIVTSIVIATAALVVIIASVCTFAMWKKKKRLEEIIEETYINLNADMSIIKPFEYDFCTVRAATNDFSEDNKIGQGGFGLVYKGKLDDGKLIAVKRLSRESGQGEQEFKNEVLLVAKLHHRNLVGLLGFSIEDTERVLIYEYFPNESLDKYIFDPNKRTFLEWDNSYKVIEGIARGLLYLHEDSRLRIIHRDLKASNILLDGEMNAKITDFGMARLFDPDVTQFKTSRIVGTYGYMSPEYVLYGEYSVKSDVFSFGVLILEIITGQRIQSFKDKDGNSNYLLSYAWRCWRDGTASDIIDPILLKGPNSFTDILRSIHIALLCIQKNVADRPTMSLVVLMLSSVSLTLQVPSEPAFFIHDNVENIATPINEYDASVEKGNRRSGSSQFSVNEATISEMNPR
uniref:putative receptor-like protein kinase At4g00960 n=1 Tax=Erigeron canadensis TaxID=72917 RepID=UPI001CB912B2|nr:putative receptor-like protein kinase At4g00960 [Erigeron canadensis]